MIHALQPKDGVLNVPEDFAGRRGEGALQWIQVLLEPFSVHGAAWSCPLSTCWLAFEHGLVTNPNLAFANIMGKEKNLLAYVRAHVLMAHGFANIL